MKTLEEILQSGEFANLVQKEINTIIDERSSRSEPPAGYHYKRDEVDRMRFGNLLNAKYFIEEIPLIWQMKSELSSQRRGIISFVCNKCLHEIYQRELEYAKIRRCKGETYNRN